MEQQFRGKRAQGLASWGWRKPVGLCLNGKVLEASNTQTGEEVACNHMARAAECPDGEVRPEEGPTAPGKNPAPPTQDAEQMDRQAGTARNCLRQQHGGEGEGGTAWLPHCR